MGGGVIIKPLLDALSPYSIFQINLISSLCVLCMALSSLIKHLIGKKKIFWKTVAYASLGALIGGLCGEFIFDAVKNAAVGAFGANADLLIKVIQNSVLAVLLIAVLVFMLVKKSQGNYEPSNSKIIKVFISCIVLGIISTFLGIGGGPINVCVLCIVMRSNTKEITFYSLFTVFWAQVAKLIKLATTGGFVNNAVFDGNLVWWAMLLMITFAVVGGIVGAVINKKCAAKIVSVVYYSVTIIVIALNLYNIVINAIGLVQLC